MLRKDLLYTAITRASEMLILCGEPEAYHRCIESGIAKRKTKLMDRMLTLGDTRESIELLPPTSLSNVDEKDVQKIKPNTASPEKDTEIEKTEEIEKEDSYFLTDKKIKGEEIPPMIGMDSLTPYSFKD